MGWAAKNTGDSKQQMPEIKSDALATFSLPIYFEIAPPAIQPKLPTEIIKNDAAEMLNDALPA